MRHFPLHRRTAMITPLLGSLIALALASSALATHPRPGGGTPLRMPLVTAFALCGAPASQHGFGALAGEPVPSCAPPVLESGMLTTGTVGAGAGTLRLDVICTAGGPPPCAGAAGDNEDISITGSITDVQCIAAGPPGCPGAGADYTGAVMAYLPVRLTDHASGPPPPAAPPPPCGVGTGAPPCTTATVVDIGIGAITGCAITVPAGAPPGSTCTWATSFDALVAPAPPSGSVEFQRQSWRLFDEVLVFEWGADGAFAPPDPGPAFPGITGPPACGWPPGAPPPACLLTGDEGITRAEGFFGP